MKHLFAASALLLVGAVHGQNLVPNPSFEEYTECPTNLSQFGRAVAWQRIGGSPDLYNSCGISDTVNVPSSFQGYQEAHSGTGFSGVITYHHDAREFIQAQLNGPLIVGVRVYVSMYVSPGGFASVGQISPELMSSGIGIRMSVNPFPVPDEYIQYYFNTAIVHMDGILQDTSNWTHLYAEVIPDSAFEYVQIGNFFSEDSTLAIEVDPDGGGLYAYAFIDDICVSQIPGVCGVANGIGPVGDIDGISAALTTEGFLLVDYGNVQRGPVTIRVFDLLGRGLWATTIDLAAGRKEYPVFTSSHGPYFVAISDMAGKSRTFKLLGLPE